MAITGIISAIIVGLIIGALGRLVVPGRQPIPIWLTMVIGIIAAFIGGFIAMAFGYSNANGGIPWIQIILQVVVAAIGNTLGSLIAYAIGAYGGRPFLERYGKYLLIRPHEIELADSFFERHGSATVFIGRLLPIVRTFISFPAGVVRMPLRTFIVYSTAGAFLWSILLVYAGTVLGANWEAIRHALQPFDLLIAFAVGLAVILFIWWRLGMPGRPRRAA